MTQATNNMSNITQETILLTRKWFADNALACIAEVEDGSVKVNDKESYYIWCRKRHDASLNGDNDHTFTFRQRAWYIQTGECIALLN